MKLKRNFFERDTLVVAQELLGKIIVRRINNLIIKARIIETEAYIGPDDKACHGRHGKTKRNMPLWGPAGYTYIYLCMGLHYLLNIVTEKDGFPAGVMIRKIEPLTDTGENFKDFGPGNTTKYLKVDRSLNNVDTIHSNEIWIENDGFVVLENKIQTAQRVGIDYAEEYREKPWRFILKKY